mmetsp:Transcript_133586/g.249834  ORF Transcript_133586/g.249834 Transcript_133586/m.249834 type:complete len:567 (-) Transcript_133586:68-1768(-)
MDPVYAEFSPITPMWALYLVILVLCLIFQILSTGGLIKHAWKSFRRLCDKRSEETVKKHVTAVVPCYLPNEEKIIKGTLEHILKEMKNVEKLDVYAVYNTPHDMPEVEAMLNEMATQTWPDGRQLFVVRVPSSTSKAHNLNHVLPQIQSDYVVIYDADHHPDPDSLALSVNHLEENNLDCVQGSTYIRQRGGFIPCLVHGEFFVTYFVTLPIMAEVCGLAFFAGSNAVWSRPSLQKLEFDHSMLTEDIDMTIRSVLQQQLKFGFLPESRSGELAPAGFRALWKQRLRWAIGWDQVTLRYTDKMSGLPWKTRLALYYILVCRYPALFCACVIVIFNAAYALASFGHGLESDDSETIGQPFMIAKAQLLSGRLFFVNVIFAYMQMLIHERGLNLLLGITLYMWMLPVILMLNALVLMTSLVKLIRGGSTPWVVTTRGTSSETTSREFRFPNMPAAGYRTAWWILGISFILMGGLFGALVGRYCGIQHKHVLDRDPQFWDFVIYGSSTTYTNAVDGRVVVFSCVMGVLVGILLLFLVTLCFPKIKHMEQPARPATESMIALTESVARQS